jgi:hypothetical protein
MVRTPCCIISTTSPGDRIAPVARPNTAPVAKTGAAFLTARLKHARFAHCFIPDPRKTLVGGGEIFLRSTNVLPPDQFL